MKKLHQLVCKITREHHDDRIKFTHNNMNLKCKQADCQLKDTDWLISEESRPIHVLYSGDPSHRQRQTQAENKEMEENLPANRKQKKAEIASLVSDKTDFKPTKIKRGKEGQYIMVKGSRQQEELTILNIYTPNTGAPR